MMEQLYPGLTRPIYFCYRKYNMDLSPGALLLEFGSNANTLEEAVYSAELAGAALAKLINENAGDVYDNT
jgi:stage II sporulation protein P